METLKNVFSNEKKWLQEGLSSTSSRRFFFSFTVLLISNHSIFLVQSGIICTGEVFKKFTRRNKFQIEFETITLPVYDVLTV